MRLRGDPPWLPAVPRRSRRMPPTANSSPGSCIGNRSHALAFVRESVSEITWPSGRGTKGPVSPQSRSVWKDAPSAAGPYRTSRAGTKWRPTA